MKRKIWVMFCVSVLLGSLLGFAGDSSAAAKKYVTIGTASAGGTFFIVAGGIADVLNHNIPNVSAVQQVTPGSSAENIPALEKKQIEMATCTSDQVYFGYKGGGMYKTAFPNIRVILSLYSAPLHFVVLAKSGIQSLKDLEGKRIAAGAPGSTQELMAREVLKFHGVKNWKHHRLTIAESINALRDGTVEAANPPAGVPISSLLDLSTSHDIRILALESKAIDLILKEHPYWNKDVIPAKSYRGQNEEIPTVGYTTLFITHKDQEEDLIYKATKAILENREKLMKVHPICKEIMLENATRGVAAPFHPGAAKYLGEKGVKLP